MIQGLKTIECVCRFSSHSNVYLGQICRTIKWMVSSVYKTPNFGSSLLWATYTNTTFNSVSSLQHNGIHCTGIPHYNELSHICLPMNTTSGCPKMNFIAAHVMDAEDVEKHTFTVVNRKGFATCPPSLVLSSPAHCSTKGGRGTGSNSSHHTSGDQFP